MELLDVLEAIRQLTKLEHDNQVINCGTSLKLISRCDITGLLFFIYMLFNFNWMRTQIKWT